MKTKPLKIAFMDILKQVDTNLSAFHSSSIKFDRLSFLFEYIIVLVISEGSAYHITFIYVHYNFENQT